MMIVAANHNGAEGCSIRLRREPLFCNHAVYLVVVRNDWPQLAALALVANETLKRVENVFEAIIEIENGELWILEMETNFDFKFVIIRIVHFASVLDLDDGGVQRSAPRWPITHKVGIGTVSFTPRFAIIVCSILKRHWVPQCALLSQLKTLLYGMTRYTSLALFSSSFVISRAFSTTSFISTKISET
jgi:hypothetical protein